MDLYRKNIHYIADSYEIYEGGRCLEAGVCNIDIRGVVKANKITFTLVGAENLPLASVFSFYFTDPEGELLADRISYLATEQGGGNMPTLCHLFIKGYDLDFIRFATLGMNGYKLFEFKGRLLEDAFQDLSAEIKTAEKIIFELKRSNSYNAENLTEWGANLYASNEGVQGAAEIKGIVEAMKLFAEADRLIRKSMEDEGAAYSISLPFVLKFLALCNYKIGNVSRAIRIAKIGIEEVENVLENSVIGGIDPNTLGKNVFEELIAKDGDDEKNDLEDEYDEDAPFNEADLKLDAAEGFVLLMEGDGSKPEEVSDRNIKSILKRIKYAGKLIWPKLNNNDEAITLFNVMDLTKQALCFCWEKLGFGHHTDLMEEGDSLMSFMLFQMDARPRLEALLRLYTLSSPFGDVDKEDYIRRGLISVFKKAMDSL